MTIEEVDNGIFKAICILVDYTGNVWQESIPKCDDFVCLTSRRLDMEDARKKARIHYKALSATPKVLIEEDHNHKRTLLDFKI